MAAAISYLPMICLKALQFTTCLIFGFLSILQYLVQLHFATTFAFLTLLVVHSQKQLEKEFEEYSTKASLKTRKILMFQLFHIFTSVLV